MPSCAGWPEPDGAPQHSRRHRRRRHVPAACSTRTRPGGPHPETPVRLGPCSPSGRATPRAWGSFQRQWIGDPLTLTPAQRVGLLAVDGWWTELASGTDCTGAMDAATRALIVSLVSDERGT